MSRSLPELVHALLPHLQDSLEEELVGGDAGRRAELGLIRHLTGADNFASGPALCRVLIVMNLVALTALLKVQLLLLHLYRFQFFTIAS